MFRFVNSMEVGLGANHRPAHLNSLASQIGEPSITRIAAARS